MRRVSVYPGAIPQEQDVLNGQKNTMISIGHVLQDMLGTGTLFSGLGCVPTGPAGMTVNVNPGRAYSLQSTDTGAYSSLAADAHPIVKQGILLDLVNFACPAPTTAGFSINYLIQGAFQEIDAGSTVLPYYNAANPAVAFSGPNGTGTSNTTFRDNTVQLQLKPGAAATTGSQVTPTPDAGFNGLWVVTVPFGATTITSGNITQFAGAPFLTASLLQLIQNAGGSYAVATGTANAHVAAFTPPITARTDGMVLRYKAPAANTGALTLNDGLGAVAVVGSAHSALQGGETAATGDVWVQWNTSIGGGSYVMVDSTGGALQVAPATQPQHALQMQQKGIAVFTSSGSFTATKTGTHYVSGVAGGGGGGGGGSNNTAAAGTCGGGGGAGQPVIRQAFTLTAGTTYTVTIGAGGAAGAGVGQGVTPSGTGGIGGGTTFSGTGITTLSLQPGGGGVGGIQGTTTGSNSGSPGGAGFPTGETSPDAPISSTSTGYAAVGGSGANGPFGAGGAGGRAGQGSGVVAQPAYGYGSGGGGGGSAYASGGSGGSGTAGMPGFAMIEW